MNTRYSLMIVEDDIFALQSMVTLLNWQEIGIDQVYQATNGQNAYELYLHKRPDIIITDLQMPIMNGISLIRTVREVKHDARTRFIIMSCLDEFTQVQQALNMGVDHYFLKANTSRKDILSIIMKVVQELDKDKPSQHAYAINMIMQRLYNGHPLSAEDSQAVFDYIGISANESYSLLLLYMTHSEPEKDAAFHASKSVKQIIEELYGSSAMMFHFSVNRYIVILKKEQLNQLASLADQLCAELPESTRLNMKLGLSSLHSDAQQLSAALSEAKHAVDTCYFTGESFALYSGKKDSTLPTEASTRLLSLHDTFLHLPRTFVNDYETRMCQIISRGYPDSVTFKKALCEMLLWMYSCADKNNSLEDIVVNCNYQILTSETLNTII